ncbi:MAG TPA: alpha/beta hydrolase, partial [Thermoanaerobaculia bacterium]|nr:alpha/beta hydrolase [Thermoanaerobaculia bacterium]
RAFLRIIMPARAIAVVGADELAERLAPLFGHDLADQPPIVSKQLAAMRACDARPRLHELAGIPTLVVSAAHDPIAPPRLGQALAAGIPDARFVEIPNASHGVPIHPADKVNALLLDHLAATEGRVATPAKPR